ncbi:MAG: flavin reductase family protein [Planctomycetota bacterium]
MKVDPATVDTTTVYSTMIRAINPRPIAWVSTCSSAGVSNLAPFSYFSGVGSQPASLMFSVVNLPDGTLKDTMRNINDNGQFVVNVVNFDLAPAMQLTSQSFDFDINEFAEAGLTEIPSERIAPPRVAESPIQFECERIQVVNIGEGEQAANVVIGKILLMHIDDQVLDEQGKIAPEKLDTIGRMGGREYCRTLDRFIPAT